MSIYETIREAKKHLDWTSQVDVAIDKVLGAALLWMDEFEGYYDDGRPMSAERMFKIPAEGRATVELAEAIIAERT